MLYNTSPCKSIQEIPQPRLGSLNLPAPTHPKIERGRKGGERYRGSCVNRNAQNIKRRSRSDRRETNDFKAPASERDVEQHPESSEAPQPASARSAGRRRRGRLPDQHATAIRGCAGERAGEGGRGAGGRRASPRTREEQVAADPSGGLPRALSKDRTCSLTTRSSSSTPTSALHRAGEKTGRKGVRRGGGEQAERRGAARGAQGKRGRGRRSWEGRGWSQTDPGQPSSPEVPRMQGWFSGLID